MELKKIIIPFLLLGLFACKKPYERSCLKTKGDETSVTLHFNQHTDSLNLYDDFYYQLVQDDQKAGTIELKGGKNLLPFVDLTSGNGKMELHNDNKCKFLRSFQNKIYATIYVDSVTYIYYEGTRELTCKDTLRSNELRFVMKEGNGTAHLIVKNGYTSASITNGVGDFTLKGRTISAYIYCRSNSYCDASDFTCSDKLIVNSMTAGTMKVNADNAQFEAHIIRDGDIHYKGTPTSLTLQKTGSGKLIHDP